ETIDFMISRRFIDLNSEFTETEGSPPLCKEPSDEFWQNDLRSTDLLGPLRLRVSLLCRAVPRPLQGQKFFLLGSIPDLGLCPTHLSRKSQRHRSVSACRAAKAL